MATVPELDVGDDAVCEVRFTVEGVLTTPSIVTWRVWAPAATVPTVYVQGTAPQATTPSAGLARLQVPVTTAGIWLVWCTGSGTAGGASKIRFYAHGMPG